MVSFTLPLYLDNLSILNIGTYLKILNPSLELNSLTDSEGKSNHSFIQATDIYEAHIMCWTLWPTLRI